MATKAQKRKPRPEKKQKKEMLEWRPPALTNTPLSHAHTASPRPLARTHDTNTKRNRNQFPDWGSPASINSPQSPIFFLEKPECAASEHLNDHRKRSSGAFKVDDLLFQYCLLFLNVEGSSCVSTLADSMLSSVTPKLLAGNL